MAGTFNYVKVDIHGDVEILTTFTRECGLPEGFYLNAIDPMPRELDLEKTNLVETGYNAQYGEWQNVARQWMLKELAAEKGYPFPLESRDQVLDCLHALDVRDSYLGPGRRFADNLAKFGHGSGETWREEHWGTRDRPDGVKVSITADAVCIWFVIDKFPIKVMKKMSKKYPDLRFDITCADDVLRNGRSLTLTNGREGAKEKLPKEELPGFLDKYRMLGKST